MQLIARNSGAFGDVAQGNLDVELSERVLHEAGVGHQLLFGFRRFETLIRKLQEIERGQLVIAYRGSGGDGQRFFARQAFATGVICDRDRILSRTWLSLDFVIFSGRGLVAVLLSKFILGQVLLWFAQNFLAAGSRDLLR